MALAFKIHNIKTVSTFKMHNIGTTNIYDNFSSLNQDCIVMICDSSLKSAQVLPKCVRGGVGI